MKNFCISPNSKVALHKIPTTSPCGNGRDNQEKVKARRQTAKFVQTLSELQELFYATSSQALLIILQGMDTSGKDGTIKKVMSMVNPQGCQVTSFKAPSTIERAHDFLWRVHKEVPRKGHFGIFNRSHYEDVLVPRVHGLLSGKDLKMRFEHINAFEHLLHHSGTIILKFFLHISKDEQRRRLKARIENPAKRWKFDVGDLEERKLWNEYMKAAEDMIKETSTTYAPWYIIPADDKWYRNLLIAKTVVNTIEKLKLGIPPGSPGVDFANLTID